MTNLPAASTGTESQFDPLIAHPARVYNVWLGGKDNFAADRWAAKKVGESRPQVIAGARANRAFLARAVRYLTADRGIRQFLDIGPGLPAPGNTHEVAQAIDPHCRVVYGDNDPLVLAHARARLPSAPEGGCDYIAADLRNHRPHPLPDHRHVRPPVAGGTRRRARQRVAASGRLPASAVR